MKKLSNQSKRNMLWRVAAVLCWILVWQAAAMALHQPLLLPTPLRVLQRLFGMLGEAVFYRSLGFTFLRIAGGFALGAALGTVLAVLASRSRAAEYLLHPLMATVKSVPVASFIILALIWLSARKLNVFISFLMVLPIVYQNLLQGLKATDRQLLEMAKVYRVPWVRRLLYIHLPCVKPYIVSALSLALGMSWKSGVAAEVIGIPMGSVGEQLYQAKVYLDAGGLFAWTLVIVCISVAFEKTLLLAVRCAFARWEGTK